jgi:transketolase
MTGLDERSIYLRKLIMMGIEETKKGHIGSALSFVEIVRVLYDDIMKYDTKRLNWPDRDRFLLGKGQGSLALYAIMADKGFIQVDEIRNYSLAGSRLGIAPEIIVPGIEMSSGSLGHAMPYGVGLALAARLQKRKSRVYAAVGDGELNEGSNWEAALAAAKHKLTNYIVVVDYNKYQIGGSVEEVTGLEPLVDKWLSFGFDVIEVDGHDVKKLRHVFKSIPRRKDKPTVVICHTIKGKGIDFMENDYKWHWKSGIDAELMAKMKNKLEVK